MTRALAPARGLVPAGLPAPRAPIVGITALIALGASGALSACVWSKPPRVAPLVEMTPAPGEPNAEDGSNPTRLSAARKGHPVVEIPGVDPDALSFSPDGGYLAYALPARQGGKGWRVLVRSVDGRERNEFDVYRPGAPDELQWVDDRRLAYLAPPEPKETRRIYVVHDAKTGEILAVRRGKKFSWSPDKKRLAYVSGRAPHQRVTVDGEPVWPRGSGTTMIRGEIAWSPSGEGLAFIESNQKGDGTLVVLVALDDTGGDLTWPLPSPAMAPGLRVFWAGESEVLIGETDLTPKFAANWKRMQ